MHTNIIRTYVCKSNIISFTKKDIGNSVKSVTKYMGLRLAGEVR